MLRILAIGCAVLTAAVLASQARDAEDPSPPPGLQDTPPITSRHTVNGVETMVSGRNIIKIDRTGKGAVLCVWEIFEFVRAVARECRQGQDDALHAELDSSLARIDQFILANSLDAVSVAGLDVMRSQARRQLQDAGPICAGFGAQLYDTYRARGAATLRDYVTDLISIPREPVMNPCF
jgi:hypothetical protein